MLQFGLSLFSNGYRLLQGFFKHNVPQRVILSDNVFSQLCKVPIKPFLLPSFRVAKAEKLLVTLFMPPEFKCVQLKCSSAAKVLYIFSIQGKNEFHARLSFIQRWGNPQVTDQLRSTHNPAFRYFCISGCVFEQELWESPQI